ncbi:MAG: family 1 glycosylhydrolase [Propionicimonas sp.]
MATRFPDGFLWGAATAAHQVEGGNIASDWWAKEWLPGTPIVEPSGDAADSYHRYREEMSLLAAAGFNSYRFSIEWSRIEPERGFFSRAAIDHYRRMVDCCIETGLTPVVTLMHFTIPQWLFLGGAWLAPDAIDRFADFVDAALPIVSDGVRYVCTINEPNIAAMLANSQDKTTLVPGALPAPDQRVGDVLLECHRAAVERLHALPGVMAGWTVATQAFEASPEPGSAERLAEYGPPRDAWYLEAVRGDDFVGVQAYTRTIIGPDGPLPPDPGVERTLTGWEYFPPALERGVRAASALAPGTPIIVTENGIATSDDQRRIAYTAQALEGLAAAMADGADVRGYLHWSALDNFEWASGYRPTFGLIAVDRTSFARTPKPSLAWLGSVARTRSLPAI